MYRIAILRFCFPTHLKTLRFPCNLPDLEPKPTYLSNSTFTHFKICTPNITYQSTSRNSFSPNSHFPSLTTENLQQKQQKTRLQNSPFAVDDEMNDRWDYLLADLSDETGTHRSDENLRYGEQRHQQPQRPNGHRMPMDQRGWMPPANSG